jgi:hypothetical protein
VDFDEKKNSRIDEQCISQLELQLEIVTGTQTQASK